MIDRHSITTAFLSVSCVISIAHGEAATSSSNPANLFGWSQNNATAVATPQREATKISAPESIENDVWATVHSIAPSKDVDTSYMELRSDDKIFWAAARNHRLHPGARIKFSTNHIIKLEHYDDDVLHRTFENLYFISELAFIENNP